MAINPVTWEADNGLAVVTLDCPNAQVNTLGKEMLTALEETAQALAESDGLTAVVVLSGKQKGFIAGADINIIAEVTDQDVAETMARRGQQVYQTWADLDIPVIAAIHGHCLGGGLEFALSCNVRVGSENAQLGLPEVKLGILPGFGGTQRLPRLVGLRKALEMILSGRTLNAEKALKSGLLDKIIVDKDFRGSALTFAREYSRLNSRAKKNSRGLLQWFLEKTPPGRALLFKKSHESIMKQTGGHYPAPFKALEVLRRTTHSPLAEGLAIEAKALAELAVSRESKNLVHIYQLSQRAKQSPITTEKPEKITHATVLGAGVMGAGIAWLLARKGLQVVLKDISEEVLGKGIEHIKGWMERKNSDQDRDSFSRIKGTINDQDIVDSQIVIEAVVEKMPIKKQVLQQTEAQISHHAIFASNTSSLSITEMQSVSRQPGNVVGLHFFNPVERMPLIEIIRGLRTSDHTLATSFELAKQLGKTPILVADSPGFLVNRLLVTYLNEACMLAEEGIDWQSIDLRAVEFGMPMGPFRLIDEVGIDIALEVGGILCAAFPYLNESKLLQKTSEAGLLGKKNNLGFYQYHDNAKPTPNPEIRDFLNQSTDKASSEDWRRLVMLMAAEASRCLSEKVVTSPEDIDTGMVFGTGFPPFRGGLCRWMDQQPLDLRRSVVKEYALRYGERFNFSAEYQASLQFYPRKS